MKYVRMMIGLAFWCGLLGVLWGAVRGQEGTTAPASRQYLSDLWGYYTSTRRLELRLPKSFDLSTGDPVFAADSKGSLQQVGVIVSLSAERSTPNSGEQTITAQAMLFPSAR